MDEDYEVALFLAVGTAGAAGGDDGGGNDATPEPLTVESNASLTRYAEKLLPWQVRCNKRLCTRT